MMYKCKTTRSHNVCCKIANFTIWFAVPGARSSKSLCGKISFGTSNCSEVPAIFREKLSVFQHMCARVNTCVVEAVLWEVSSTCLVWGGFLQPSWFRKVSNASFFSPFLFFCWGSPAKIAGFGVFSEWKFPGRAWLPLLGLLHMLNLWGASRGSAPLFICTCICLVGYIWYLRVNPNIRTCLLELACFPNCNF